ncbi:DNA replication complex GINS protein PSF2 [Daldinia childiae]|uniref:DNA replication complex GINS protein PSF2 n=1 Tax=Daldinia childiae TaxID=326645 RepID=UPI00144736B0|nr:DNA replication complex GINS protein PSF2 [Daldinia childiae]KAF3061290.1 DNA replication complex GINS protein PSF2 [Daldinia childiae]
MALPLPPGLVPTEVAFLCEMEMVTVVPRQRLESIPLLSGKTPALRPPHRAQIPLWLAILLKKQRRANIVAPPWLYPDSLKDIIHYETNIDPVAFSPPPPPPMRSDGRGGARPYAQSSFELKPGDMLLSPPFLPSCTQEAPSGYLPYHWLELSETLLAHAADDIPNAAEVRTLLRDLQEVRAAKMRSSTVHLEGGGVLKLRGVGAMELAESRGFVLGVVEGVRKLGASAEASRREEEEERANGEGAEDSDEEMGL